MAARKDCYTEEEKDEIIAHVLVNVSCGRFVSRIFREDETTADGIKLPHVATFWKWMLDDEDGELNDKLARAREQGIEALLDEVADIADNTANDTIRNEAGVEQANTEWITRSRLRVDTRIKLAQMMKPKKYGPKLDLTSGGEKIGLSAEVEAARKRAAE
jgi:hypothetical protein